MMLLEWPVGARSRGTHSTNCPSSFSAPPSSLVLVLLLLLLGPCSDSGVIRILQGVSSISLPCHDWRNQLVRDGDEFIPDKNEPCRVCLCNGGVHTTCNMKPCPPPACYRLEEVKNICCEYRCLDAGLDNIHHNKTGDKNAIGNVKRRSDDDIADQGLRLAASTVTSFLVLALLLFMVHRLCQRRHLIQMRRLNAPRNHHDDDNDNNPFSQDAFSIGMPCPPPYDCPPPPYTPPRPFAYIQPCEAPPPYEEVQNQMASNNPAFSGSLSPTSRATDPSDCNSAQEPGSVSSMPGLGLGGIAPDNQTGSIDMEDNSSIHETTPKTPFGADEGQFTTSSFTVSAHSPTMNRPFSTFFGSCTVNENSNGNGGVVRNSCGSIAARAERIRSCLFPSGKDHQDGVALGLTSQQAMAALSLRETGEETLPSKAEMFAPWYIKRSESIEIRRESRSPRNSYCFRNNYAPSDSSESESESEMPDMSSSWLKGSGNSTSMGLTATSPQSHTHPAGSNLSSFKPNNSRVANPQSSDCCNNRDPRRMSENSGNSFANGGIKPTKAEGHKQVTPGRPVRISYVDSCKSSLNNNNNNNIHTPTATTPTAAPTRCLNSPDNNGREHSEASGISKFDSANQLANSSFVQSQEFGMNPSTLRIRNSLPPLELKALQPEMRKMETLTRSSAITPPSALALSIVAGASAGGLLSVEHADDSHSERNFWNFHHPANLLNGRLQSPGTPVSSGSSPSRISIGMLQDRSNSLTSDISLFSICSETGEKKRTKEISSSCNSTSTIATTPTATTTTDICNNNNNNSNNNNLNNNNNNNNNNSGGGGGPPIKNDVPYPDLFQANSSSSSNGGGGGVGGAVGGGGGAGGGGPHSSNQVTADANQMPLPRRETMTTASLVSNILKRYSDVPRQSMEHDENSCCKPSSSSTSSSSSSSSSSNTVSLVANQQQQQQQQPQAQHLHTQSQRQRQQPQAQHLHTQNQRQQQQPQAQHLHTQNQQQQPQAQHLHTQNQQQQPQAQHLHTQNQQQQPQQHLHQKQEQQHNNNNNNSHNNYHNKTSSSSNNNNSAHHNNNNNSSHYYHHHHHRSNRNTDSGPASSPLVGNSGASTGSGGGGGGGAMGGDCAFAQPYPRKSEIRTLDHRSSNRKSIDDVIRTIDITPVLQSIAKPLDNTAREGSSREVSEGGGGGSKSRFSALECGVGKHFLSAGFPFGDKPPPPPPPPLPMFPKPKSSPADRKKRHSVATNGGNVSKQSKTKLSTAAKGVAGKFHEDIGISTNGMKVISSGAALLENMKESINNAGSSSKSESSPNRGCKSRSGSNGSGNNPNTAGHHRTACEPCFKLYGYVDDPSVLYNCCHRMETDKETIIDRYKNTSVDKNPPPNNNISPAMMKYLTSSPKSSDNGPQSTSYTAAVDSAGSCVGGGGGVANANSGNTGHSSMYRPKKQSQLRTSPEHKSKSGSSVAYKASAGAVGNYATLNSHSHPSQNANTQKKRHGRSKDKNRKSYPGASPEGAPRGSYAGACPEGGAPRETKIVSNPWLTTSSSGASASSASPARRKFEKTHRSKHHNSVILDMSRTYTDDCQAPQNSGGRHGNQVLNHVDQLSSYV